LLCGSIVIKCALLPIALLSEEAQEACNKNYKNFRENHTRKSSRISINTDLMHALLINSDAVVSSNQKIMITPIMELPSSVKQLIIMNDEEETEDSDTCSDSE
jgi:hypothetical protein